MISFFQRLFGNYECPTCKVLEKQLEFERSRSQELTEAIVELVTPREKQPVQSVPRATIPSTLAVMPSKVRARLEAIDRVAARVAATSSHLGRTDTEKANQIEELEKELGIKEEDNGSSN